MPYQGACVRKCPEPHFAFMSGNNQPRCEYIGDRTKNIPLNSVPAIFQQEGKPLPTMESLKKEDPGRYALFNAETTRVDAALAILMSTIDKQIQIDNAFKELQKAENIRDKSPEAYGTARVAYYSLVKGPEWIGEEKKRLLAAEVEPEVVRYRQSYLDIDGRKKIQMQTRDVMESVKSGVLSLKDDFRYTTKTFKDQIDTLKSQINIERRGREKPIDGDYDFFKWIDVFLNLLIVVGLLYVAVIVWRKMPAYTGDQAPRLGPV